jgi:hypothetical protein
MQLLLAVVVAEVLVVIPLQALALEVLLLAGHV